LGNRRRNQATVRSGGDFPLYRAPRLPMTVSITGGGGGGGGGSTGFFTFWSSRCATNSSRALAYLGVPGVPGTVAHSSGVISCTVTRYFWKWLRRRSCTGFSAE